MSSLPALLLLSAVVQAEPEFKWVNVEQKESRISLIDFGDRRDGAAHGYHTWFGSSLMLAASMYAAEGLGDLHAIHAGGKFSEGRAINVDPKTKFHYGFHVAFFDAEDRLLACGGSDEISRNSPVKLKIGDYESNQLPIPYGVERRVDSYKVAYYESNAPIGQAAVDEETPVSVTFHGDKSGTKSWPQWKSDGERRGKPWPVRPGFHRLPLDPATGVKAETLEKPCAFVKPKPGEKPISAIDSLGKEFRVQATTKFEVRDDDTVEFWLNLHNTSERSGHSTLYVAFFDRHGNLVAASRFHAKTEPGQWVPGITVTPQGGVPEDRSSASSFNGGGRMPLPRNFSKKIASYCVTLYESDRELGTK